MVAPVKLNFKIYQGSTFNEVLRWESSTKVYKTITAIYQSAPLAIQAPTHGVPVGWRVKITNVVGMKEINSDSVYHTVTAADTNTVTINAVNSVGYSAYVSGGILEYNEPVTLTGYTARMQIREKLGSTTIIKELTTENGGITLDNANKTITINISATDTAAFTFKQAVYSMELVNGSTVTPFLTGSLSLENEITR